MGHWWPIGWVVSNSGRDRHDLQHEVILETWYAFIFQRNTIVNVLQQHLNTLRNDENRHLKLAIYIPGETPRYAPINKLVFFAKKRAGNLLLDLSNAEDWFRSAIHLLNVRNQMKEQMDNEPGTLRAFDENTGQQLLIADVRREFLLRQVTEALYAKADAANRAVEKALTDLQENSEKRGFRIPTVVFES